MTDRDEQHTTPVASRRALLLGAGALGAVGVLAACGTDAPATDTPAATSDPTGGQSTTTKSPAAPTTTSANSGGISASDIPVGGGKIFAAQKIVVTQPTAGAFKAFSAVCTHQGCLVTSVSGGEIGCACHGSAFKVADGSVAKGPAVKALPAKTVTVTGDTLTVT